MNEQEKEWWKAWISGVHNEFDVYLDEERQIYEFTKAKVEHIVAEASRRAVEKRDQEIRDSWDEMVKTADEKMKATNGHSFVTILKTRCQYCGKSPSVKTKCGSWFLRFVDLLRSEVLSKLTPPKTP